MQALIQTAERINEYANSNNYVFQRHVKAYKSIPHEALWQKDVLELGCGAGYGMEMLAPETRHYTGIDKRRPPVRAYAQQVWFQQMDLANLSVLPSEQYDTILCFQVIEHIQKDVRLLQQAKRLLKPGGCLYLTTPNRLMSLTRNPFHIREYTPRSMRALVAQVFTDFTVEGITGNEQVQQYYWQNKEQVEKWTRFDWFQLQQRLPRWLLKAPYSLLNNASRLWLYKKDSTLTNTLHYSDFQVTAVNDDCLDFFVRARK